ncbi:lipopolysaccharide biosynthesis protein [Pseudomonas citronellolis]|uniref:lipopolysaccharide biosynthesis protein n=1 Tax=Pseudomonas citronellolis TaxID=53408 RepID=UPI0009F3DD00|nr:oligosaccharide flippase family protein [Pseudomonas humi]
MRISTSRYRPGRLARAAVITLFWQMVRIGALALWMLVTARLLGPAGYGVYTGLASLAIAVGALTGLGLGFVMYQGTIHNPERFSGYWMNALAAALASGCILSALFSVFGEGLIPGTSHTLLLAIGTSEILLFPLVTVSAFAFSAHERLGWATMLPAMAATLRLGGNMLFYWLTPSFDVEHYVWYHAIATGMSALISLTLVGRLLAPSKAKIAINRKDFTEGLGFACGWVGSNALTSLDKTFALKFGSPEVAGIYSIAYRFVTILAQPIDALLAAALPRLFVQGATPAKHPQLLALLIGSTLGYGAASGLLIWLSAPFIPQLLGNAFEPAVKIIRILAIVIPLYGLRVAISQALIGRRQKKVKSLIELLAITLLLSLSVLFVPKLGAIGAAYACLGSEAFLALGAALAVTRTAKNRQETQRDQVNNKEM